LIQSSSSRQARLLAFTLAALEESQYAANQIVLCSKLVYARRQQDGNKSTTTTTTTTTTITTFHIPRRMPARSEHQSGGRVHVLTMIEIHPGFTNFVERKDDMAQCVLATSLGRSLRQTERLSPLLVVIPFIIGHGSSAILYATPFGTHELQPIILSVVIVQTAVWIKPLTSCELFSNRAVLIQQAISMLLSVDSNPCNNRPADSRNLETW